MLLKPLLKLQRPLPTPSKQKPEFAMTQAQWQAEGRLKLNLACRWKWWLARVDVERRLDSLWSLCILGELLVDYREHSWAWFFGTYVMSNSWAWFFMYYNHLNTQYYFLLLILDRTASESLFILYNTCIINSLLKLLSWVQILQLVQLRSHEGIINRRALNLYVERRTLESKQCKYEMSVYNTHLS